MLKNSFCSSPWFHVRLAHDGSFEQCRWGKDCKTSNNIKDSTILEFFNSNYMTQLRTELLNGNSPQICSNCYYEDSFDKLNGRHRQLNKSAVFKKDFDLSLRSSPHYNDFLYSHNNEGKTTKTPVDLQIDLGNTCNSACIMCHPRFSSRLESEYKKLNKINPDFFKIDKEVISWTKDNKLIEKFVNEIDKFGDIKYIHFLGGETLYDESFYTICERLIENGMSKEVIVGTTTNGTVFDQRIKNIISNFKSFHLGISIETVTELNDYIRYPSKINNVLNNIKEFINLRNENPNIFISLRITPNIFSIYEFDQTFKFMVENNITAESCFILNDPPCLSMEILPDDIRTDILKKFEKIITKYNLKESKIVNTRNPNNIHKVNADTFLDYYNFIKNYNQLPNLEEERYNLVKFLKSFEAIRKNSIIDYAPRYTEFLRHYGYRY